MMLKLIKIYQKIKKKILKLEKTIVELNYSLIIKNLKFRLMKLFKILTIKKVIFYKNLKKKENHFWRKLNKKKILLTKKLLIFQLFQNKLVIINKTLKIQKKKYCLFSLLIKIKFIKLYKINLRMIFQELKIHKFFQIFKKNQKKNSNI